MTFFAKRPLLSLFLGFLTIFSRTLFFGRTTMPPFSDVMHPLTTADFYTADPVGTAALFGFDRFALQSVMHGTIPFWNPYTLLGQPFLAEFQWGIFYPPSYLRLLLPYAYCDFYSLFHVWLIAFFIYRLTREIGLEKRYAAFSALCTFGSGFIASYLPTSIIIAVLPWTFLVLWGIERTVRRSWIAAWPALVAGAYGLGTAGHPTLSIFGVMFLGAYVVARALLARETVPKLITTLPFFLVAALLSAPNWLTFAQYALTEARNTFSLWASPNFYSALQLPSYLIPHLYGDLNVPITSLFHVQAGMAWMPAAVAFPVCLGMCTRDKTLLGLLCASAFLALFGLGVPPFSWIARLPSLARLNINYLWAYPYLATCCFAGFGLRLLVDGDPEVIRRAIKRWHWLLAVAVIVALHVYTHTRFSTYASALGSALIPGVAWGLGLPLVLRRKPYAVIAAVIVSAVLYFPTGLPRRTSPDPMPAAAKFLRDHDDGMAWRVYGVGGALARNDYVPFGISTVNNQNAVLPAAARAFVGESLDSRQNANVFFGIPTSRDPDEAPLAQFVRHRKWWDDIGTRFIVLADDYKEEGFDPAKLGLRLVSDHPTILLNPSARPRMYFTGESAAISNIALTPNDVRASVSSTSAGRLVLVDTFTKGWTATINGVSTPVLPIEGVFRGVALPGAGHYDVELHYRPPLWRLAQALALAGLVALFVIAIYSGSPNLYRPRA